MDSAALRMFEAVARLGAINRAAAELNTVQSNVTVRIRQLEQELGTPLFQRHSRGVVLTPAGKRLLPFATSMGKLLKEAREAVTDEGTPKGTLVIGSLETTAAFRLTPVLTKFGNAYPQVDIIVKTATNADMIDAILDYRLDAAFVCGPVEQQELETDLAFREELVLVSAPGTPHLDNLLGTSNLKILVKGPGCSYRQRFDEILARRGVTNVRRSEFGTLEAIIGCVMAGLGVALLPRSLVERSSLYGRVAIHELDASEAQVETLFVRHRDAHPSSAITAFRHCVLGGDIQRAAAE